MPEVTTGTVFRSGKNVSGATIVKNRFVSQGATYQEVVLPAAVTTQGYGVTTEDIPDQGTGSIQVEGVKEVECSAAVSIGALVQSGTDGRAATAATSSMIRGVARSATTGSGQLLEVELWVGRYIAP
jgi:hypothetical protein